MPAVRLRELSKTFLRIISLNPKHEPLEDYFLRRVDAAAVEPRAVPEPAD